MKPNKPNDDRVVISFSLSRGMVNYLKTALTQLSVGIPMLLIWVNLQAPISPPQPPPSHAIEQSN